jgi:hypothetical protein
MSASTHSAPEVSAPKRRLGGSRKGCRNKATAARERAIAESGLTPLEYMIRVMRDENQPPDMRLDAARSAAPYVHPKLAQTQITGKDGGPIKVEDATRVTLLGEIMSVLKRKE